MVWIAVLAAAGVIAYLASSLSRLRRENEQMAERIVGVERLKKDFISRVSHDLKAPLASMQETTQILLARIPGPLTDRQKRMLDLNMQSGKRLAQMLGNILDLTRLEAGIVEYDMKVSDLSSLIQNAVGQLDGLVSEKSLQLITEIPPEPLMVECDSNRMIQLFTNLLDNAIRFSNKGGSIGLHVKTVPQPPPMPQSSLTRLAGARKSSRFALVRISDSGPGVQDPMKEQLFEKFSQAKPGKKSQGESLGLGLAISRNLVEAHQGAIWIEDNPSGGAIFSVLLPCVTARTEPLAEAS